MTSVDELRVELNQLRDSVSGMHEDLRRVATQLQEIIRLDGDMRRHGDAVDRIGREVDDHEQRIRTLEDARHQAQEWMRGSAGHRERLWWVVGLILSALLGAGAQNLAGG